MVERIGAIDCRVRPMTKEFAENWANAIKVMTRPLAGMADVEAPLENLFQQMDEFGVSKMVIVGRSAYVQAGMDHIAGLLKSYPNRFAAGFAGLDPLRKMDAVRDTERAVKELGLSGVAFDPFVTGSPMNDKVYYPILAKCVELDAAIIVNTGAAPLGIKSIVPANPITVDEVASDFPTLRILLSHAGWPWIREAIAVAKRHRNVYLECSLYYDYPGVEDFVKAANDIVPDQVVYASAYPIDPVSTIETFRRLPFREDILAKICYQNAAKFLKLGV